VALVTAIFAEETMVAKRRGAHWPYYCTQ